jgi:ABC-type enterochelin transport system ATPase subunit
VLSGGISKISVGVARRRHRYVISILEIELLILDEPTNNLDIERASLAYDNLFTQYTKAILSKLAGMSRYMLFQIDLALVCLPANSANAIRQG